jgi:GDSL-like Lipase/Acylhydrolase family
VGCGDDAATTHDSGATLDSGGDAGLPGNDAAALDASPDAALPAPGPVRYHHDPLVSPLTDHVMDNLRDIAGLDPAAADNVFMKVGASGTVSANLLYCFAGSGYTLDLDGRDELQPSIDHFAQGDAAGTTPFDRASLAAEVGRSAVWAISGDPSPLDSERAALHPRYALVNYGTNDMQLGTTHRSALWGFAENLAELLDQLTDQGVVSIVTGLNPRTDLVSATHWVPTYNAVTRGLAEARQLPYINLYRATVDMVDSGLVADGVHGNVYVDSSAEPCVFTPTGLAYNYNLRNLLTLEVLDDVKRTLSDGAPAPDDRVDEWSGDGSPGTPFLVDRLPFTHTADTAVSPHENVDAYPACDTGQDESGPEYLYRLELSETTPIRILVIAAPGVDVDLHLLDDTATPEGCLDRDHRILEHTLDPGIYHLMVDTWVSTTGPLSGSYLLVALACEPGDPDC